MTGDRVWPSAPIVLVRLGRDGPGGVVVGETRRVTHVVAVPAPGEVVVVLRAYCGLTIPPVMAELLDGIDGAPCPECLAKVAVPGAALPAGHARHRR